MIKPYRDLTQASDSLPAVSSLTYEFDNYPAGVHKLYYYSAAAQEQGGLSISFDRRTKSELEDVTGYYKLLEFTVLP